LVGVDLWVFSLLITKNKNMDQQEKNQELAKLQLVIEEVEEHGHGEIIIKVQDNKIVAAEGSKKYKF
jgi:hypothetical protein